MSLSACDVEVSPPFYEEFFSPKRIPAPTFRHPVAWLRLGAQLPGAAGAALYYSAAKS